MAAAGRSTISPYNGIDGYSKKSDGEMKGVIIGVGINQSIGMGIGFFRAFWGTHELDERTPKRLRHPSFRKNTSRWDGLRGSTTGSVGGAS